MNEEKKEQIRVYIKFLFVFIFAALYAWGGMEDKWLRRYLAPTILGLGMFLFSKDKRSLIQIPLMMITLSLGYGSDVNWIKFLKRLFFGFCNGLSSTSYYIVIKDWIIVFLQVFICMIICTVLGVFNPMGSARAEEMAIGAFIALIPMLAVEKKNAG